MQKKIQIFMEKYHMIENGDHLVAGISGGADSVCLLLILKELQERMHFSLTAVHVEHGIRGAESLRDAQFSKKLCEQLGLPFLSYSVDAPAKAKEDHMSLEEAARVLRYACFEEACVQSGANKIAVAHHGDDCAETVLFHLSRGTGLRGLCGISPVRSKEMFPEFGEASQKNYTVIRPLLGVRRTEIEAYLKARGQEYCTDSTNQDLALSRNRIRSQVVPELSEINPQAVQHMVRTAAQMEEICDYIDQTAWEQGKDGVHCICEGEVMREIHVEEQVFSTLHPVIQKNLMHRVIALAAGSRKDITALHVEAVCDLFENQVGRHLSLPYGLAAYRDYDGIVLIREQNDKIPEKKQEACMTELVVPGETIWQDGTKIHTEIIPFSGFYQQIPQKKYTKWFDYDKIKSNVLVRTRCPGDYLQIGAFGGRKKLKNFFVDEKVPQRRRDEILLLADGPHILWVVGYRMSEAYKVTHETKRILCVCVDGGQNKDE